MSCLIAGRLKPLQAANHVGPSPSMDRIRVYTDGSCRYNGTPRARGGFGVFFPDDIERSFCGPLVGSHRTRFDVISKSAAPPLNQALDHWVRHFQIELFQNHLLSCGCSKRPQFKTMAGLVDQYRANITSVSYPSGEVRRPTNQRAELSAILKSIVECLQDLRPIEIHTDSMYCYLELTKWCHDWGPSRKVVNMDLFKTIIEVIGQHSHPIFIRHVQSHASDHHNNMADSLASIGALLD